MRQKNNWTIPVYVKSGSKRDEPSNLKGVTGATALFSEMIAVKL